MDRLAAALFAVLFLLASSCEATEEQTPDSLSNDGITRFINGAWYENGEFVTEDKFVKDGFFTTAISNPSETVDLGGAFIVPPFAEGHHHTVMCNPERIQQFTEAGIYYVQIMNARVSLKKCQEEMHHSITAPEIANTYAGITGSKSHPVQIGEYFLAPEEIDGEWVHIIDSKSDLEEKWSAIEATKPDMLKLFLSYSEDYAFLKDNENVPIWYKGLNPELVPLIVEKAHEDGMRVAAHVMSAHDFSVAVNAGVDVIAHMPGFASGPGLTLDFGNPWLVSLIDQPERYRIVPEDATLAVQRNVKVITTLSGIDEVFSNRAAIEKQISAALGNSGNADAMLTHWIEVWHLAAETNIKLLRTAGVEILIGSDRGEYNAVDEAEFLVREGLLTPEESLYALSVATPKAIFPERSFASFDPGDEASFLALGANPLVDFHAIRSITLKMKKGAVVE